MEKKFCDGPECGKEIDESTGFYNTESRYKERDYGIALSSEEVDFCSLRCLIAWAEEKRRSRVVREDKTEMGKHKETLYSWEGKYVPSNDIERKNNRYRLTKDAYERLK